MEYHWINPDADRTLQQGWTRTPTINSAPSPASLLTKKDWNASGASLAPSRAVHPNAPYTQFPYMVNGRPVDLVFQMNEGGMSKLNTDWLGS